MKELILVLPVQVKGKLSDMAKERLVEAIVKAIDDSDVQTLFNIEVFTGRLEEHL